MFFLSSLKNTFYIILMPCIICNMNVKKKPIKPSICIYNLFYFVHIFYYHSYLFLSNISQDKKTAFSHVTIAESVPKVCEGGGGGGAPRVVGWGAVEVGRGLKLRALQVAVWLMARGGGGGGVNMKGLVFYDLQGVELLPYHRKSEKIYVTFFITLSLQASAILKGYF